MKWTDVFKTALQEIEDELSPVLGEVLDEGSKVGIASAVAIAHIMAEKLAVALAPPKS